MLMHDETYTRCMKYLTDISSKQDAYNCNHVLEIIIDIAFSPKFSTNSQIKKSEKVIKIASSFLFNYQRKACHNLNFKISQN